MVYDVLIIGAGPAGMTAGIYAARRKLNLVLLEGGAPGGEMALASKIENYPGFRTISGVELAKKMKSQLRKFGVKITYEEAVGIKKGNAHFEVITSKNNTLCAKALILASGARYRKLGVKGEEEFVGRGVSYCTMCDAPFFKKKMVAVIGGGNTALSSALFLSGIAKKVYLIHRREELRGDEILRDEIKKAKVELILNSALTEIVGNKKVREIRINTNGKERSIRVEGVFVHVGVVPANELAKKIGVKTTPNGYVIVDEKQRTNIDGVFAAGDITGMPHLVVVAAAQGAIAATSAYEYLREKI